MPRWRSRGRVARFRSQLLARPTAIIAEFKRHSPSAGDIQAGADPVEIARLYESGGAAAMSVLTEPEHFKGSLDDLRRVAAGRTVAAAAQRLHGRPSSGL